MRKQAAFWRSGFYFVAGTVQGLSIRTEWKGFFPQYFCWLVKLLLNIQAGRKEDIKSPYLLDKQFYHTEASHAKINTWIYGRARIQTFHDKLLYNTIGVFEFNLFGVIISCTNMILRWDSWIFFFLWPNMLSSTFCGIFSHDGGRGHLKKQSSLNMGKSLFLQCTMYLIDPAGPVSAVDSK